MLLRLWRHLELDEDVTVAPVVDGGLHGFIETDSDGAEVNVARLDLDTTVRSSSEYFQVVFFVERRLDRICGAFLGEPRTRIVEANRVLDVIVDVPCIDRDVDVVVLLLQCSKCGYDLALFVWEQEGLGRGELDFILVFVWHLPFVLKRDSRLVFDLQLLLARNSLVDWWEEQFLVVAQLEGRLVAVSHQIDLLDVCGVVIVDALGLEVELSWLSRVELEADDTKALAVDETHRRESLESLGGILEDFVVHRGVTRVRNLDCLVYRLVWATTWESYVILWAQFHHRDEWL